MSIQSFDELCVKFGESIQCKTTSMRLSISPREIIAVTLEISRDIAILTQGGVKGVFLYKHWENHNMNRGFCFIEFDSHKRAVLAKTSLAGQLPEMWNCSDIVVNWAIPEPCADKDVMSKVKKIFIRGLRLETKAEVVRQTVSSVLETEVLRRYIRKTRDYAFVSFETRAQTLNAIDKLNGTVIDGADVEVQLARPPPVEFWKLDDDKHNICKRPPKSNTSKAPVVPRNSNTDVQQQKQSTSTALNQLDESSCVSQYNMNQNCSMIEKFEVNYFSQLVCVELCSFNPVLPGENYYSKTYFEWNYERFEDSFGQGCTTQWEFNNCNPPIEAVVNYVPPLELPQLLG